MTKIIQSDDFCHCIAFRIPSNLYQQNDTTMEMNLSIYDIAVRYVLMGACGIIGALTGHYWLMVIGVVFFLTAILGICPIYTLLGINNSKKAKDDYK